MNKYFKLSILGIFLVSIFIIFQNAINYRKDLLEKNISLSTKEEFEKVQAQESESGGVKGGTFNLWRENFTQLGFAAFPEGDCNEINLGPLPSDRNSYELFFCAQSGLEPNCNLLINYRGIENTAEQISYFPGSTIYDNSANQYFSGIYSGYISAILDPENPNTTPKAGRIRIEFTDLGTNYPFYLFKYDYRQPINLTVQSGNCSFFEGRIEEGNLIIRRYYSTCASGSIPPSCSSNVKSAIVTVWYR